VMAEEYLAEKVAAALGDICGVVVSVQIAPEDAAARRTATVRVPRRYLAAAGRARLGRPGDAEQVRAILIEQTDGIRRTVASVIGARDAADVSVEWYADAPDETLASEAAQAGSGGLYVLAALCAIGGAAAAGLLGLRRFRRQAGKRDESPCRAGRPSLLAEADAHRILELVRDEHPQAIALVLSRLGPAKAAIVLAGLEPARKAEVMRRLDGAEAVAPDIASEVEAALLSRLAGAPGRDEVEREAPRSTAAAAPQAMEPLHGRSFVFEDLAQIPAGRLADGLRILPEEDLVLALRTAGDGLKKKLLSCLPDGSARKIRREMSRIGPVRLMDVEAAQQRVVEALRQAEMGSYAADDGVRREVPA